MRTRKVAATFAAACGVVLGACGQSNTSSMDDGLKKDLAAAGGSSMELAPNSANQRMTVSAIEGGPVSAPARASTRNPTAPKPVVKPAEHPTQSVAQAPIPTPAPAPIVTTPVSSVQKSPVEPSPLPPMTQSPARQQSRQAGPYKTEAEIFRQMPWIRP